MAVSRRAILLLIGLIIAGLGAGTTAGAAEIGGAVYTFNLESDGQFHLRGYACIRKGNTTDQGNHPSVEAYLGAPVVFGPDGSPLPGSGTLVKAGVADQSESTEEEAKACDYIHDDSPPEAFWRSMRFNLAFSKAELAPIVGRRLYVSGVWRSPSTPIPVEAQLANSPRVVPEDLMLDPLTVACTGPTGSPGIADKVTWTATAQGGTGLYAFAWSDDQGNSDTTGSTAQWSTGPYPTSGAKVTTVTVLDNRLQRIPSSAQCQVSVVLDVNASVLPSSRSVALNQTATAFLAAAVASTLEPATGCTIKPDQLSTDFSFQETDPTTNAPTGQPNAMFDLPASSYKTFVVSLTPSAELAPTEVWLNVSCAKGAQSTKVSGVNTLLLSASTEAVADVIAVAATPSNDGTLTVETGDPGAFAIAAVNLGVTSGLAVVVSDTSGLVPAGRLSICQTNAQGQCLVAPSAGGILVTLAQGGTATFSVFVAPTVAIPSDPEKNRLVVEFRDFFGVVRGRTSVAIEALAPPPPPSS